MPKCLILMEKLKAEDTCLWDIAHLCMGSSTQGAPHCVQGNSSFAPSVLCLSGSLAAPCPSFARTHGLETAAPLSDLSSISHNIQQLWGGMAASHGDGWGKSPTHHNKIKALLYVARKVFHKRLPTTSELPDTSLASRTGVLGTW